MKHSILLLITFFISILTMAQFPSKTKILEQIKWRTYLNNQLGFTFQYPDRWVEEKEVTKISNLKGEITSENIVFNDTLTHSSFNVEYSFAPKGAEKYQYALSQFKTSQGWYKKDSKQIIVAERNAIEAHLINNFDGKGHSLSQSSEKIIVEFLDKMYSGEIKIIFGMSSGNSDEIVLFNYILSTFEFINDSLNNTLK